MKSIIFIISIITKFSLFLCLDNPADLNSDYPFSIKKDINTAIIFSSETITIFDVTKTQIPQDPITVYPLSGSGACPSGWEKGGIFFSDYYYTSCLNPSDNTKFQIKIYDSDFNYITETDYYTFTSAIKFFVKEATDSIIEAVWLNDHFFNTIKLDNNGFIKYTNYPVNNMARDTDCIYNKEFNKIICAYGIKENDIYACAVNIFTDDDIFISNLKKYQICTDHQSRKIKEDNNDKNSFYYYFVDTKFTAYILPLKLISSSIVENGNVMKIMNGCDESQNSFDLSQDKFNGYFVFSCVESRFKKKIKIQLFKIQNNEIIFYEDKNINKTFEFEEEGTTSEFSMINFIVLKSSLNFGFLSYRTNTNQGRYTIFNQPRCSNYELSMNTQTLYQNKEIILNFVNIIQNDNYAGGKIQIIEQGEGMDVSVLSTNTDVKFISEDYITGILQFTFRVTNTFYKSGICIAYIEVKECFTHCKTCSIKKDDFYNQECEEGCKTGSYPMINFPKDINSNCCEKNVDCPDYMYFSTNQYEICHVSCLTCTYGTENSCTKCYNEEELEGLSQIEQAYVKEIKQEISSLYYYWENDKHLKCVNKENEPYYYLDKENLTYKDCYYSCESCLGEGNSNNNTCTRCKEDSLYYHFEDINSFNCLNRDQVPKNYYLNSDSYSPTETVQSRFWTSCNSVCASCLGGNKEDCTSCSYKYYPKCSEINNEKFECYNTLPEINYFLNENKNCYQMCDPSCETCEEEPTVERSNCLSCYDPDILFEKNCYTHCPLPYYELNHKICVDKCPAYTLEEFTQININEYYNQCYNCKEIGKCIYLGSQKVSEELLHVCIECNAISKTFQSNNDYNILDDCYDLCSTCTERGTLFQMNCLSCDNPNHCLVEDTNNCAVKNSEIDYYYMSINDDDSCSYKKCYISCKFCNGEGNSVNNNCISCAEGYQPDPNNEGNCVKICDYYWYTDPTTGKFSCTQGATCPRNLPYLAEISKECVQDCIYAYNFNTIALFKHNKKCVTQCPDNTMKDNLNYACYSLDDSKDIFNNIQNYISYQTSNPKNILIYSNDKTKYFHLFNTTRIGLSTYEQSAKGVGTSLVDFSYCLATLRNEYSYDNNEIFYIGIMDVIRDDTSAPQFEFSIHDHSGIKLDINLCKDDTIIVNKSFIHNTDMDLAKYVKTFYNYDIVKYNKDNNFFCDICTKFQYDKKDPFDIILNDRYNSFYLNKDYFFCEDFCDSDKTKVYLNDSRVE